MAEISKPASANELENSANNSFSNSLSAKKFKDKPLVFQKNDVAACSRIQQEIKNVIESTVTQFKNSLQAELLSQKKNLEKQSNSEGGRGHAPRSRGSSKSRRRVSVNRQTEEAGSGHDNKVDIAVVEKYAESLQQSQQAIIQLTATVGQLLAAQKETPKKLNLPSSVIQEPGGSTEKQCRVKSEDSVCEEIKKMRIEVTEALKDTVDGERDRERKGVESVVHKELKALKEELEKLKSEKGRVEKPEKYVESGKRDEVNNLREELSSLKAHFGFDSALKDIRDQFEFEKEVLECDLKSSQEIIKALREELQNQRFEQEKLKIENRALTRFKDSKTKLEATVEEQKIQIDSLRAVVDQRISEATEKGELSTLYAQEKTKLAQTEMELKRAKRQLTELIEKNMEFQTVLTPKISVLSEEKLGLEVELKSVQDQLVKVQKQFEIVNSQREEILRKNVVLKNECRQFRKQWSEQHQGYLDLKRSNSDLAFANRRLQSELDECKVKLSEAVDALEVAYKHIELQSSQIAKVSENPDAMVVQYLNDACTKLSLLEEEIKGQFKPSRCLSIGALGSSARESHKETTARLLFESDSGRESCQLRTRGVGVRHADRPHRTLSAQLPKKSAKTAPAVDSVEYPLFTNKTSAIGFVQAANSEYESGHSSSSRDRVVETSPNRKYYSEFAKRESRGGIRGRSVKHTLRDNFKVSGGIVRETLSESEISSSELDQCRTPKLRLEKPLLMPYGHPKPGDARNGVGEPTIDIVPKMSVLSPVNDNSDSLVRSRKSETSCLVVRRRDSKISSESETEFFTPMKNTVESTKVTKRSDMQVVRKLIFADGLNGSNQLRQKGRHENIDVVFRNTSSVEGSASEDNSELDNCHSDKVVNPVCEEIRSDSWRSDQKVELGAAGIERRKVLGRGTGLPPKLIESQEDSRVNARSTRGCVESSTVQACRNLSLSAKEPPVAENLVSLRGSAVVAEPEEGTQELAEDIGSGRGFTSSEFIARTACSVQTSILHGQSTSCEAADEPISSATSVVRCFTKTAVDGDGKVGILLSPKKKNSVRIFSTDTRLTTLDFMGFSPKHARNKPVSTPLQSSELFGRDSLESRDSYVNPENRYPKSVRIGISENIREVIGHLSVGMLSKQDDSLCKSDISGAKSVFKVVSNVDGSLNDPGFVASDELGVDSFSDSASSSVNAGDGNEETGYSSGRKQVVNTAVEVKISAEKLGTQIDAANVNLAHDLAEETGGKVFGCLKAFSTENDSVDAAAYMAITGGEHVGLSEEKNRVSMYGLSEDDLTDSVTVDRAPVVRALSESVRATDFESLEGVKESSPDSIMKSLVKKLSFDDAGGGRTSAKDNSPADEFPDFDPVLLIGLTSGNSSNSVQREPADPLSSLSSKSESKSGRDGLNLGTPSRHVATELFQLAPNFRIELSGSDDSLMRKGSTKADLSSLPNQEFRDVDHKYKVENDKEVEKLKTDLITDRGRGMDEKEESSAPESFAISHGKRSSDEDSFWN